MPMFYTEGGFFKAIEKGDEATLAQYLKKDKDRYLRVTNRAGEYGLHIAAKEGRLNAIRMLLDAGAAIDARTPYDFSPLAMAVQYSQIESAALLLEKGASTDATSDHRLPLVLAVQRDRPAMVQMLLKAKADPDRGQPLLYAVNYGYDKVALLLLEAGAKPDVHSGDYLYPVHRAAMNGSLDLLAALLDKGADINLRDRENGYTALHWAVVYDKPQVAEYLLEKGARVDLMANRGSTPLELAIRKREQSMIRLLKKYDHSIPAPQAEKPKKASKTEDSEQWVKMGVGKVAHVGTYPALGRKLTEIFNFTSRDRIIITENLKSGAENMGAPESFDALEPGAVKKAVEAYKALGGEIDEEAILNPRSLNKKSLRPQP